MPMDSPNRRVTSGLAVAELEIRPPKYITWYTILTNVQHGCDICHMLFTCIAKVLSQFNSNPYRFPSSTMI